jgi:hypothetical protein
MPWTDIDDKIIGEDSSAGYLQDRFSRARKESRRAKGLWSHITDAILEGAANSPLGAEPVARAIARTRDPGATDERINEAERKILEGIEQRRNVRDLATKEAGTLSPTNIGKLAVDLAGNVIGGADPTYVLAPGKTIAQRIAAQAGINAGVDVVNQGVPLKRKIRDKYDPRSTIISGVGGAALQGAGEVVGRVRTGRRVARGSKMPGWQEVNDVIVRDLEGGGTLSRPKVSPKGAMGPQQVMPETARKPGFGIRPWNGKTQADLARVGRQYSAAMMDKYDGDVTKVLAAYNAGPGRVDGLIKRYGEDWRSHLPDETKKYVSKGLGKLGRETPPEDLGDVRLVENELPDIYEMARVNDALAPQDREALQGIVEEASLPESDITIYPKDRLPELTEDELGDMLARGRPAAEVHDLSEIRSERLAEAGRKQAADNLKLSQDILRMTQEGNPAISLGEAVEARQAADDMLSRLKEGTEAHYITSQIKGNLDETIKRLEGNIAEGGPPSIKPTDLGLGKGSVATTPVNDFKKLIKDIIDDDSGVFRPLDWRKTKVSSYNADGKQVTAIEVFDKETGKPIAFARRLPYEDQETWLKRAMDRAKELLNDDSGVFRPFGRGGYDPRSPEGPNQPSDIPFEELGSVEKLNRITRDLKGLQGEQKQLYHQARAEKAAKLAQEQAREGGLEGYYKEASALKGELPKVGYETIRQHFSSDEISELLNMIKRSNSLMPYERFSAQTALLNLLGADVAKVPAPKDLEHLENVFGEELIGNLMSLRKEDPWAKVWNTLNIPRALMASVDLSAPLRQGVGFVGKKEFWKALGPMHKALFSEDYSKAVMARIKNDPDYIYAKKAGLGIVDPHTHRLMAREEDFMSDYAEGGQGKNVFSKAWKNSGGAIVRASNRAYSTFLNQLRFDVYKSLKGKYEAAGIEFDAAVNKRTANFVNTFSGRGDLGRLNSSAPALTAMLFSPRLMASRVRMLLSPVNMVGDIARGDTIMLKERMKALLAYTAYTTGVLGLAAAAGMDVETDPRSSDFAKPKKGNTRYDVSGGMQPYVRLLAQWLTHSKVTGSGEEQELGGGLNPPPEGPFDDSMWDVFERFIRTKESPLASVIHNFGEGENVVGEDFYRKKRVGTEKYGVDLPEELLEKFTPMSLNALDEIRQDEGFMAALGATPALTYGVGSTTYKPRKSKAEKKAAKEELMLSDDDVNLNDDFDIAEWDF